MAEGNGIPVWAPVGDWDGDESTSAPLLLPLGGLGGPPLLLGLPLLLAALPSSLVALVALALALLGRTVLLATTSAESFASPGSPNSSLASTPPGVLVSGSGSVGVGGDLARARARGFGRSAI